MFARNRAGVAAVFNELPRAAPVMYVGPRTVIIQRPEGSQPSQQRDLRCQVGVVPPRPAVKKPLNLPFRQQVAGEEGEAIHLSVEFIASVVTAHVQRLIRPQFCRAKVRRLPCRSGLRPRRVVEANLHAVRRT